MGDASAGRPTPVHHRQAPHLEDAQPRRRQVADGVIGGHRETLQPALGDGVERRPQRRRQGSLARFYGVEGTVLKAIPRIAMTMMKMM